MKFFGFLFPVEQLGDLDDPPADNDLIGLSSGEDCTIRMWALTSGEFSQWQ